VIHVQIIDHYLRVLRSNPAFETKVEIELSLEQVSKTLFCTPRNSKLILKKMVDLNLIIWTPGRGRGNRSRIQFKLDPLDVVFGQAKEYVQKGEIRSAILIVEKYDAVIPFLAEKFQLWFRSQFGHHVESKEERAIDILRIPLKNNLLSLDPMQTVIRTESHLVKQVCDTLVRYDNRTNQIDPHLAYYWETNEAGDEWTFYLRKGVFFHNGEYLTAKDVLFTFKRLQMKDTASPYRWLVEEINEMIVLNNHTVKMKLKSPNYLFLHFCSSEHLSILPKDYCEQLGNDFEKFLVGTGPFKIIRNDGSKFVLEAFESYFLERAHLDRIELWIIPNNESHIELIDESNYMIQYVAPPFSSKKTSSFRDWNWTSKLEWSVQYITLNMKKKGPLQNPNFRKFLLKILARNEMIEELKGLRQVVAHRFLPVNEDIIPVLDEQKGDQSNCFNGETLLVHTFNDYDHIEDCEWMKERLSNYGIKLEVKYLPTLELLDPLSMEKADILHDSATVDENYYLSFIDMLISSNSFMHNHFDRKVLTHIKKEISHVCQVKTDEERRSILHNLENYLLNELAFLPLYRNEAQLVSHPDLHGISVNSQGWVDYRKLWFKKTIHEKKE
jgi:SgrR family transcriptional regulator